MLKQFMNGTSLLAMALRSPNDDGASEKSPVQLAREEIAKNTQVADGGEALDDKNKVEPEVDEDEPAEDDEEADDEPIDEDEVDGETDEAKATRLAKAADDKEKRRQARVQKRIDTAVAKQKAAEARAAAAEAKLAEKPDAEKPGLSVEDVKKEAKRIADEDRAAEKFDAACQKLAEGAEKIDKDFQKKVQAMTEVNGLIPGKMIGILEELDNGAEVLSFLANDEDAAEDIYALADKPEKMAIKLVKLSDKLIAAKKKPAKEISKVTSNEPIRAGGRVNSNNITAKDTKPENMADFVAKRNAQDAEKRKQRGY